MCLFCHEWELTYVVDCGLHWPQDCFGIGPKTKGYSTEWKCIECLKKKTKTVYWCRTSSTERAALHMYYKKNPKV